MSEVTNGDLMQVLLRSGEDIGAIKATLESQAKAFAQHLQDDAVLSRSVSELRLTAAKRAGAAGVWQMLYGAISGVVGAAVASMFKHG